jgi:leucyl aminopeptidase
MASSVKIRFVSFADAAKQAGSSSKRTGRGSAKEASSTNLVVFAGRDAAISKATRAHLGAGAKTYDHAAAAASFKGSMKSSIELLAVEGAGADRLIAVGIAKKGEAAKDEGKPARGGARKARTEPAKITGEEPDKPADYAALGGYVQGKLGKKGGAVAVFFDLLEYDGPAADAAADFAMGLRLRGYTFDVYKTKKTSNGKENGNGNGEFDVAIAVDDPAAARKAYASREAIGDGIMLARDLVNEPSNVLSPMEFAKRAKALTKLGVKVEVLDRNAMKRLGMGALLGVAQGSEFPPATVIMRWNGARSTKEQPVAFIGKGVTFDSGGISIKPAAGMEDMKGDMAGAACVTGLMHALAARKAKVNAIGAIGLVENMASGSAQRPGDIVKTMSGQTVEVINTDAEGRLVLADVLWHVQNKYRPQFMINLATLTGAILVALGKEYAGLFSNNDDLSEKIRLAGEATGERVWRMPLGPEYDKLLDSKFADMKNIGGRLAGSITAAQFLQRFVNKVPWTHLDIAGTGFASSSSDINQSWGSGWGVRLLDRLVADNYES